MGEISTQTPTGIMFIGPRAWSNGQTDPGLGASIPDRADRYLERQGNLHIQSGMLFFWSSQYFYHTIPSHPYVYSI